MLQVTNKNNFYTWLVERKCTLNCCQGAPGLDTVSGARRSVVRGKR